MEVGLLEKSGKREERTGGKVEIDSRKISSVGLAKRYKVLLKAIGRPKSLRRERYVTDSMEERGRLWKGNRKVKVYSQ